VASAITVANAASELEDLNFPNFASAYSTVLLVTTAVLFAAKLRTPRSRTFATA
jgi:hypothetical protein